MSIHVDGVEYLTAVEAVKEIGGSRQSFYANVKPYLKPYHFHSRKSPWYSKAEVIALATGKPIRKASIAITGMFSDWTSHASSLGYNIESKDCETKIEHLPDDVAETFSIATDKQFVRKTQMSYIDGSPVCIWSTWYPVELVGNILPQIQDGSFHDVVGYLADKGYPVSEVSDVYSSRITTPDEMNRFMLLNDEPLIIVRRMAKTPDKQIVALFQDMELMASWFVVKRVETVDYWNK